MMMVKIVKNNIDIINTIGAHAVDESRMIDLVNWILASEKSSAPWNISLIFVDDKFITQLNGRFLGKSTPTDVISFNLTDSPEQAEGEVYISVDTAEANARQYAVELGDELYRLAAHGVYHLLGYDDAAPAQRRHMTELENKALEYIHSTL